MSYIYVLHTKDSCNKHKGKGNQLPKENCNQRTKS